MERVTAKISVTLDLKVLRRLDKLAGVDGVKRPAELTMLINQKFREVFGDGGDDSDDGVLIL